MKHSLREIFGAIGEIFTAPPMLYAGSTHTQDIDEVIQAQLELAATIQKKAREEKKMAQPKYKVGDRVRMVDDKKKIMHNGIPANYAGQIAEIIAHNSTAIHEPYGEAEGYGAKFDDGTKWDIRSYQIVGLADEAPAHKLKVGDIGIYVGDFWKYNLDKLQFGEYIKVIKLDSDGNPKVVRLKEGLTDDNKEFGLYAKNFLLEGAPIPEEYRERLGKLRDGKKSKPEAPPKFYEGQTVIKTKNSHRDMFVRGEKLKIVRKANVSWETQWVCRHEDSGVEEFVLEHLLEPAPSDKHYDMIVWDSVDHTLEFPTPYTSKTFVMSKKEAAEKYGYKDTSPVNFKSIAARTLYGKK